MKLDKLDKLRRAAERDPKLTDGACRLFLNALEFSIAISAKDLTFPLSHAEASKLCGIKDKATIYARLKNLSPQYLKRVGVSGCPPTNHYKINL